MVRIGIDINMKTNIAEGYMIMEYKVRELFSNGKKQLLNKDCYVRFIQHLPEYCKADSKQWIGVRLMTDETLTAQDVYAMYERYQKEIDSLCGLAEKRLFPQTAYELLSLVSDVDSYCGLR